ncbi:MAG: tryptophan synthase subunit alpha [Cyclobacteriaceae bacterium]|nr:tryptophan synthase subunit alpha [Cyclobacteriaceae bacterium]
MEVIDQKENRINALFKKNKKGLLSVYYTAGFPMRDDTVRIGKLLEASGADILEIGVPFSDPVADGSVIQASNKAALDNGMTLRLLLDQVSELRNRVKAPIILMGYFNPIFQFGVKAFCEAAAAAGVDGLIIPDLPLLEYQEMYKATFEANGLQNIFLISPTTSEERIRTIDSVSNGFIYAVSSSSTTGAKKDFSKDQRSYFERLQKMKLKNPLLIGFGISNREAFTAACKYSAGAIVGSAFISMLKKSDNMEEDIPEFVNALKNS